MSHEVTHGESIEAPSTPGLTLPCPLCGEQEASIRMSLADPTQFSCEECSGDFERYHIEAILARWPMVFGWIDQMPG